MTHNLNPIDAFEIDVLDHTGDIDLAQRVGDAARHAVTTAAEAITQVLGINVDPASLAATMLDPNPSDD